MSELDITSSTLAGSIDANSEELDTEEVDVSTNVTSSDVVITNIVGRGAQADWEQEDSNADDYIKNKPEIPSVEQVRINKQNIAAEEIRAKDVEARCVYNELGVSTDIEISAQSYIQLTADHNNVYINNDSIEISNGNGDVSMLINGDIALVYGDLVGAASDILYDDSKDYSEGTIGFEIQQLKALIQSLVNK